MPASLPQNKAAVPTLSLASTWVVGNRGALTVLCILGLLRMVTGARKIRENLDIGARPYVKEDGTVAKAYDAWTNDRIVENLWGEHIHLGYYNLEERQNGAYKKDFVGAKVDLINKLIEWSGLIRSIESGFFNTTSHMVLDVGCGIGGTSRYLASKFGEKTLVIGITISPAQVMRATQLAKEQKIENVQFYVMDAMDMAFHDECFDVVWGCESGEHMPDKGRYIKEMIRVLKPGGRLIVATWCQRDEAGAPLTVKEQSKLEYLYNHWSHPPFVSINEYYWIMKNTNELNNIALGDWTNETVPSWRHTLVVGAMKPWTWIPILGFNHKRWWSYLQDAWCLERMHQAFSDGLMQYGILTSTRRIHHKI